MLTVICPSRGRPDGAAEVTKTFLATATSLDTTLVFVVDPDDVTAADYPAAPGEPAVLTLVLPEKPADRGMLPALAAGLKRILAADVDDELTVIGFVGDDHRFRTPGWDAAIEDYLELHPGVAYADDLLKRQELPTQWFVSRSIVDVFGMGLPGLFHLYIDDYWKTLAAGAGCLYYMPDLIIEHMHPTVGKAEWDDGYRAVNAPEMYAHDNAVFTAWLSSDYRRDVETLAQIIAT
jgi:hypothetical protein